MARTPLSMRLVLQLALVTLVLAREGAQKKRPPALAPIATGTAQPTGVLNPLAPPSHAADAAADDVVCAKDPTPKSPLTTPKGKEDMRRILEAEFKVPVKKDDAYAAASAAAASEHWDPLVAQLRTACADQDIAALTKTILSKMHVTSAAPFYTAELDAPVDTDSVISRASECNKANNDLVYAVRKLAAKPAFVTEAETLFAQSRPQICYAIVFAGVLDRLGELAAKDFTVISHFVDASAKLRNSDWGAYRRKFCAKKGLFGAVKQLSVEKPFSGSLLPALQAVADAGQDKKDLPFEPSFGVPINIGEAMYTDDDDKFPENAAVGARLVETALLPFASYIGRSEGNSGKNSLEFFYEWPPTPKAWSDLYQVWNMAFVVRFDDWTIMFSKLLNPYVACYNAPHDPARYIYRRAVSLLMAIVAIVDELMHDKPTNDSPKWSPEFRRAFGAANAQSAARFRQAMLAKATPDQRKLLAEPNRWLWRKFLKAYESETARENAVRFTPLASTGTGSASHFPSSPKSAERPTPSSPREPRSPYSPRSPGKQVK